MSKNMKISKLFNLGVNQLQLDFIDINLDKDYPLFVDPHLISTRSDPWSVEVDRTIKNFFSKVSNYIKNKEYGKAIELFQFMSEPKENCLGVSSKGTKNGKGVGEFNATEIINEIIKSKAIERGIVKNIEDIVVLVDNIGPDKLSDMTTNLIRKHLIEYTKEQCDMWGIPTQKEESLAYWNPVIEDWDYSYEDLLFYGDTEILLTPKSIVSYIDNYSAEEYDWYFVVPREVNQHLERRTQLVKIKTYKSGKQLEYVTKTDVSDFISKQIKNEELISKKDYLRQYTENHPEIYEAFRNKNNKTSKSLPNDEFMEYTGRIDTDDLIDNLIELLKKIPLGTKHASIYHKFIKHILAIVFYPQLTNPTIEENLHDGRKRVDIVMNNIASEGFFYRLHNINKIPSAYIMIECKNYSKDISNPELDQLSGRFSFNKGKFGILMCRKIEDKKLFYKRCSDTYNDDRGLIIPLDDDDIIEILQLVKKNMDFEILLENIKRKVILNG